MYKEQLEAWLKIKLKAEGIKWEIFSQENSEIVDNIIIYWDTFRYEFFTELYEVWQYKTIQIAKDKINIARDSTGIIGKFGED